MQVRTVDGLLIVITTARKSPGEFEIKHPPAQDDAVSYHSAVPPELDYVPAVVDERLERFAGVLAENHLLSLVGHDCRRPCHRSPGLDPPSIEIGFSAGGGLAKST